MPRDVFVLYRPEVPEPRAQSVQVVHAAHALAARGHRVELWAEGPGGAEAALTAYGLDPVPGLRLRVVGAGRTAASVGYRLAFAAWVLRTGGRGVAIARRKRHAAWALARFGGRFRLVLEAHEVDSRQAEERGEDPRPDRALEAQVLAGSVGVLANAEGTLDLLRATHPGRVPPARVVHNAARPGPPPRPDASGIGVVGSIRPYKDPHTVARAAALGDQPITWVGGEDAALIALGGGRLRTAPGVPHREVPALLSTFRVLLVPLSAGLFGDRLTSPLKLWDALQSGVPVVAADTAAIREAAGDAVATYPPGDAAALCAVLTGVSRDEALRAALVARARRRARTWADRAAEVEAFLDRVAP